MSRLGALPKATHAFRSTAAMMSSLSCHAGPVHRAFSMLGSVASVDKPTFEPLITMKSNTPHVYHNKNQHYILLNLCMYVYRYKNELTYCD
ncbi:hypothetical protein X798_03142 [Onchocerca flexuosa]|uniref:Uncharacterized protein n=1 Tax=Onchocerca flexuosa TaxID=387005 RepID=A0A238BWS2_9BILA|nr:hypothetical protein X798_03142 [Onchocerca flexuosa]